MLGQDKGSAPAPQVWFMIAMAALVMVLLGSIFLGDSPPTESPIARFSERLIERMQAARAEVLAEEPSIPEAQAADETAVVPANAPDDLAEAESVSPPLQPSPTLKPDDALRRDHYWLERPFVAPANTRVARFYPYGSRLDGSYPIHVGVEMVNPAGTPVLAPASGVVVVAGDDDLQSYGARSGFYGLLVILQLDQRFQGMPVYALFAHLSEVHVAVGQHVSVGHQLGLVGETGYAEAPHVHTEIRVGRNDYYATVNPELWYRPLEGHGTVAGRVVNPDGSPVDSEVRVVLSRAGMALYETYTYPLQTVNPDPEWGENFCIGDLEAGVWTVEVFVGGRLYRRDVTIQSGQTTWVVIGAG